ncbi:MAG: endonuclease/exonuclease/phosphatase family protein, partial [Myxococcota bacterium]
GEGGLGEQEISVGLFYRRDRVSPIGAPAVLDARAGLGFDASRNRPILARSFRHVATGERLTVAVNHWKSKGSPCDGAGDPDLGDGQGHCNRTRTRAAEALVAWLAGDPTRAGGAPALIVGDLNAYANEDPVMALTTAGFVDLLDRFGGPESYSYVFDGAAGRLDHALASAELAPLAHGAAVWHANSDEPPIFDYRAENPPFAFAADPYRASDHDPVLVDLFPDGDGDGRTDARDACPETELGPTVVWDGCVSGVPEQIDASGCSLADRLGAIAAAPAGRNSPVSAVRRALRHYSADGTLAPRERVAILACVRRSA